MESNAQNGLAAPPGSAITLTQNQRDILYHTAHRAPGGFYCGGGKDVGVLVAAGLMQSAGFKSFVPDEYFRLTSAGRAALRQSPNAERDRPAGGQP